MCFSWKNTLHSKFKFWMIKMSEDDLELQIINRQQELSLLSAPCQWDWIKVHNFFISGWNQIQFNLSDFTRRAYGSNYIETLRVTIHANCRIRRIYFSDRLYSEEELPPEFKLFLPIQKQQWVDWFSDCVLYFWLHFCGFIMCKNVLFFVLISFYYWLDFKIIVIFGIKIFIYMIYFL